MQGRLASGARFDQRSPEAKRYRRWYKSPRWQAIRRAQLTAHPLCQRHLQRTPPQIVPATVVHHVEPHRGDEALFFGGPFTSLCKACHDGEVQSEERTGYSRQVGVDGWPVDPKHPFHG